MNQSLIQKQIKKKPQQLRKSVNTQQFVNINNSATNINPIQASATGNFNNSAIILNSSANYGNQNAYDFIATSSLPLGSGKARSKGSNLESRCSNKDQSNPSSVMRQANTSSALSQ